MSEHYRPAEVAEHRELNQQELVELYNDPGQFLGGEAQQVSTGEGVVTEKTKPLYTQNLWGCVAIYVEAGNKTALYHLTPKESTYSYRTQEVSGEGRASSEVQAMIQEITASLNAADKSDAKACIIGNIGLEDDSKYSYQVLQKEWEFLRQSLETAGVRQTAVVEVPMDKTTVAHIPDDPDSLYVIGLKTSIQDTGYQLTDQKTIVSKKISLKNLHTELFPHPVSFHAQEQKRVNGADADVLENEYKALLTEKYNLEAIGREGVGTQEQIDRYGKIKITLNVLKQELRMKFQPATSSDSKFTLGG